ncbi:DUF3159 domain-containing protein [Streptomyces sp. NBC_01795]|uniref:DUF3159 domain-containing protein n=1 Tax=unclassified Streptomyces TaxID=2593676 RepID=UPI002DD94ACD|nr:MULTISPECIES: DUF3159 domain-containing protein [unclassified Streptomyces]WSA97338.1 DUF3159 domain-containing protein [Streptomyces sp. NBC_01795]WSB81768.1 DUF3159 domain-containing protein [Streptomyces sp. NBC_01775]WSS17469.1 DUF3159 domain-containing protein [Streptomyces sp. NBC_01186]WSS46218.1 DUF3159 domain-containing protein [Streptomyces sp. NBC_01187]
MKTTSSQETATDTQAQQVPGRRKQASALDQMGGSRGLMYSTLPVVAFVVANNVRGLKVAIITAAALAVGIAVERLWRKESLQPALGGLFGVAVAAGISWYTGSAKDYFLIGIWASLGGAVLFLVSVLARWPLAGVIWNSATGKGTVWRADKRSRFYYDVATLVLAGIFGTRFVVQQWLYDSDQVGSLGFAKIAMGFPLLGLGLLVVAWASRCSNKRLKAVGLLPAGRS